MKRPLLGELLLEKKEITREQLDKAMETQTKNGGLIGIILVTQGAITEATLVAYLSLQAEMVTSS
ncbi:MAG: hypothetical protein LBT84_07420 [Spirochaetia bacterium]|jgi:hypothetical protein|nr:hypothetical protein [Spirochaetia bacterium]